MNIWIKYWRSDFRRTVLSLVAGFAPNTFPILKKRIRTDFLSSHKADSVAVLEAGLNRIAVKKIHDGKVSVVIITYKNGKWEVTDECYT